MAHSGDHRNVGVINRLGYHFFIKSPQVLHGATASPGDHEVSHLVKVGPTDSSGNFLRRSLSLDPHGQDPHLCHGPTGPQDTQHVPYRSSRRRSHQSDAPRHPGQGLLVLLGKESLAQQSFFQLFKGYKQVPRTLWGEADAVHLVLPVPGKDGYPPGGDDLHPVLRTETQGGSIPPEHHAPQGPLPVFQGKVVVAGGIHLIVGQLPPHQQTGQKPVPVHKAFDILSHLTGGEDGRFLSHWALSRSRARQVKMAVPMALSVEKRG